MCVVAGGAEGAGAGDEEAGEVGMGMREVTDGTGRDGVVVTAVAARRGVARCTDSILTSDW